MPAKKQTGGHVAKSVAKAPPPLSKRASSSGGSITDIDLALLEGLAGRTKATRELRGFLVAADFCDHAGISKQYLGNIELKRTKRPEALPMLKLAKGLDVSLEWLLTGEPLPSREALSLTPDEFDMVAAMRTAPAEVFKMVVYVLKPYLLQAGKPAVAEKKGKK